MKKKGNGCWNCRNYEKGECVCWGTTHMQTECYTPENVKHAYIALSALRRVLIDFLFRIQSKKRMGSEDTPKERK